LVERSVRTFFVNQNWLLLPRRWQSQSCFNRYVVVYNKLLIDTSIATSMTQFVP